MMKEYEQIRLKPKDKVKVINWGGAHDLDDTRANKFGLANWARGVCYDFMGYPPCPYDVFEIIDTDENCVAIKDKDNNQYIFTNSTKYLEKLSGETDVPDDRRAFWIEPVYPGRTYCNPFNIDTLSKNIEINNKPKKTMIQKLTNTLKKNLPGPIQSQYKAGLRDGDLELTELGVNELLALLADKYASELTSRAEEIIKESEDK